MRGAVNERGGEAIVATQGGGRGRVVGILEATPRDLLIVDIASEGNAAEHKQGPGPCSIYYL